MFFILACKPTQNCYSAWVPYDETEEVAKLLPMHPQNAIQSYPINLEK
jgi:hypothetical protein